MQATATRTRIQAGQMLMGTWGYEQTNASFYKVLKVASGFATLIEYRTDRRESAPLSMCGTTVPTEPTAGPAFRRKIHAPEWSDSEHVRIESYMIARPWDGKPVRTSWYG